MNFSMLWLLVVVYRFVEIVLALYVFGGGV